MAVMSVNPTRMELTRLKKRLQVARRGYKLLKDKRDELMKAFLGMVVRNKELREKTEEMLRQYYDEFLHARAATEPGMLEEALMFPKWTALLDASARNIMSVEVPELSFENPDRQETDIHPYGFAFTSGRLDNAIELLMDAFPHMIELAQIEKSVRLLSYEIEKTRRRVNALEYVLIPQLEETIRYIAMKLEESERGNLARLMKVKDMMLERTRKK